MVAKQRICLPVDKRLCCTSRDSISTNDDARFCHGAAFRSRAVAAIMWTAPASASLALCECDNVRRSISPS